MAAIIEHAYDPHHGKKLDQTEHAEQNCENAANAHCKIHHDMAPKLINGAQGRSRTDTPFRALRSKRRASTNFATWALPISS